MINNKDIMDIVLSPENIQRTRERAERYVSAIYPAPDMHKERNKALKETLGATLLGAIPYALGAHSLGRTIANASAYSIGQDYMATKAREEAHKEVMTNLLSKMLEMQTEAYLTQEQDESRRQTWERFLQMYNHIAGASGQMDPKQIAGALLGAAVESGLDAKQFDMLSKTIGMADKLAQNPRAANKAMFDLKVIPAGGALVKFNKQTGQWEPIPISSPSRPVDDTLRQYRIAMAMKALAQVEKTAREEAINQLSFDPEIGKYLLNLGGGVYKWKDNTPPEIMQKAQDFVERYVASRVYGGKITQPVPRVPNIESGAEPEPGPNEQTIKGILGLLDEEEKRRWEEKQKPKPEPFVPDTSKMDFQPPYDLLFPEKSKGNEDLDRILMEY